MDNREGKSELKDPASSQKASITTIPNEIFEMIVGAIAFVDLPYFLQASKRLNVPVLLRPGFTDTVG